MKKTLKNIAQLSSGYSFRGALPLDHTGSIRVIQASDIGKNGSIASDHLNTVLESSVSKSAILHDGDILLVSRGMDLGSFRAAVFRDDSGDAIATSSLHVIRTADATLSPEYLCAYLNSHRGQVSILKIATGSSVKMLSLGELGRIQIPIPAKDAQNTFSSLVKNIAQQKNLLKHKTGLLDQLQRASTIQLTK